MGGQGGVHQLALGRPCLLFRWPWSPSTHALCAQLWKVNATPSARWQCTQGGAGRPTCDALTGICRARLTRGMKAAHLPFTWLPHLCVPAFQTSCSPPVIVLRSLESLLRPLRPSPNLPLGNSRPSKAGRLVPQPPHCQLLETRCSPFTETSSSSRGTRQSPPTL